ncbi:MAG: hypothetical protein ACOCPX_04990 [Halapricum sp.]
MEGVFALVFTLVLSVLPTLLFLGLWRGLMALRDDELVERLEVEHYPESTVAPQLSFLGTDISDMLPGRWFSPGVRWSKLRGDSREE